MSSLIKIDSGFYRISINLLDSDIRNAVRQLLLIVNISVIIYSGVLIYSILLWAWLCLNILYNTIDEMGRIFDKIPLKYFRITNIKKYERFFNKLLLPYLRKASIYYLVIVIVIILILKSHLSSLESRLNLSTMFIIIAIVGILGFRWNLLISIRNKRRNKQRLDAYLFQSQFSITWMKFLILSISVFIIIGWLLLPTAYYTTILLDKIFHKLIFDVFNYNDLYCGIIENLSKTMDNKALGIWVNNKKTIGFLEPESLSLLFTLFDPINYNYKNFLENIQQRFFLIITCFILTNFVFFVSHLYNARPEILPNIKHIAKSVIASFILVLISLLSR